MARERSPNRDKAFEIYKEHKGDIDLVEIAKLLDISSGTVRGWKNKDDWDNKLNGTFQKNTERSNEKSSKKNIKKVPIADEVKEVLGNAELTDKQRLFCDYYIKYRNKTKAYMKAYRCSYANAHSNAYKLWQNMAIKNEIEKQLQELRDNIKIDIQDLIQLNIDIAFADMKDYAEWGKKEIEAGKDEKGKPIKIEINYVDFKDSNEVDGTIISEIKKGKDGVSVKLQDKMKAIEFLKKHIEFLDEDTKRKLGIEEQKTRIEVLKSKVPNTSTIDMQGQITALADLINNPVKERTLDD